MIFKILQGIPLFQDVTASMANFFPLEPHLLIQKNLEWIKYHLFIKPYQEQAIIKKTNAL